MTGRLIKRELIIHSNDLPESVIYKLREAFEKSGFRTKTTGNIVEASSGSSFLLRLLGTHFRTGRNNVPFGLTASVDSAEDGGSTVQLYAYDKLGYYIDLHQNDIFKTETSVGTEKLLSIASETLIDQ